MISNDILLNTSAFLTLFFLLLWGMCFFIFVYKILGGPKAGRDSFLYFNFMFFNRTVLSGCGVIFLVLGYISAAILEYRRIPNELMLTSNLSGGLSFLFFALYGRYFYRGFTDDKNPFFFIKIFLMELDVSLRSFFLWLSRTAYITWLIMFIVN